jgi:hypothetical protein
MLLAGFPLVMRGGPALGLAPERRFLQSFQPPQPGGYVLAPEKAPADLLQERVVGSRTACWPPAVCSPVRHGQ